MSGQISVALSYIQGWQIVVLLGSTVLFVVLMGELARRPELALALQFNGTIVYLYSMYSLGFQPQDVITGGMHLLLIVCYLSGGFLLFKRRPKLMLMDLLLVLFFAWILVNHMLFSIGSSYALEKLRFAPALAIAPYFGARFLLSQERVNRFLQYSVLIPAVMTVPSFLEIATRQLMGQVRFTPFAFGQGQVGSPIVVGISFAIGLIILIVRLGEGVRKARKYHFILLPLFAYLVLVSGSRGVVISLLAAILFYILFQVQRLKTALYVVVILGLILGAAWQFLPGVTASFYRTTFQYQPGRLSTVYQRLYAWREATRNFLESPLWGIGFGNFRFWTGKATLTYPHNIILEIAAELGFIGVSVFAMMMAATLMVCLKHIKRAKNSTLARELRIVLVLFLFALAEAMFSAGLTSQIYLFVTTGLIWSLVSVNKRQQSSRRHGYTQ